MVLRLLPDLLPKLLIWLKRRREVQLFKNVPPWSSAIHGFHFITHISIGRIPESNPVVPTVFLPVCSELSSLQSPSVQMRRRKRRKTGNLMLYQDSFLRRRRSLS
ncbi:hypothetical protein ATANTOWER_009486 [Ataeniobius toweri]|uniref:Uncharacterized protein n=1 Tax=Ataeniobius toweri TaxID=208326 RepID=A0ABU7BB39_9TELE|nr:hypothetical protein [Ataeniobius toweri]